MRCGKKDCLRQATHCVHVDLDGEMWITANGNLWSWQETDLCHRHLGGYVARKSSEGFQVRVVPIQ
jgi:hypothetical protein